MTPISLLLVLVAAVAADKIPDFVVPGQCPNVDEKKLWSEQVPSHSRMKGVWYEYGLTTNPYQLIERCVRHHYDFDGKQFEVSSTGIAADGNLIRKNGQIYPMPLGEPHLTIDFENSFAAPFVVLETDYSNYACVYSCVNFGPDFYTDFAFIFSRAPTLEDGYVRKCEGAFKGVDVDTARFVKTAQGASCPYDTQKTL